MLKQFFNVWTVNSNINMQMQIVCSRNIFFVGEQGPSGEPGSQL